MDTIKLLITALITSFILDMIWLGVIAKDLYETNIGFLLRKVDGKLAPVWSSAAVVYLAIVSGIILFVIPKANGSTFYALIWGAIFGGITYAIYDFTNHATLANWPFKIVMIDIAWGMFLCGVTSCVTVAIAKWI